MTDAEDDLHLLTVQELADLLNVSASWVRKAVLQRTIPYTKIGRNVRFTPHQLTDIIRSGEQQPIPNNDNLRATRPGTARTKL